MNEKNPEPVPAAKSGGSTTSVGGSAAIVPAENRSVNRNFVLVALVNGRRKTAHERKMLAEICIAFAQRSTIYEQVKTYEEERWLDTKNIT